MTNQPEQRHSDAMPYQSFLVRLWKDCEIALWRGSAQSVQTGEVVHFANLTELFTFLEAQTNEPPTEEIRAGWRHHPAQNSNSQTDSSQSKKINRS